MKEFLYRSIRLYCTSALWFYFKRWQIATAKQLPTGPIIFVANHQNAFLDAVVMACSMNRTSWFLARAGVFEKRWAQTVLTWLKMMPVFRFRDGFSTIKKNDKTFDACIALLEKKEAISIFAEGNHDGRWRLRPLQKGFARIALAAEEKNDWRLGLKIVPVGIQYENGNASQSRVLVTFGESFLVRDVIHQQDAPVQQIQDLITYTASSLEPLILHLSEDNYQDRETYLLTHRYVVKNLSEQLVVDQAIARSYQAEQLQPVNRKKRFWDLFYSYWFANTLVSWTLIQWVLNTKMEDAQFTGSLKFSLGMVLVPVTLVAQALAVYHFTSSGLMSSLYFVSVPLALKLHSWTNWKTWRPPLKTDMAK